MSKTSLKMMQEHDCVDENFAVHLRLKALAVVKRTRYNGIDSS